MMLRRNLKLRRAPFVIFCILASAMLSRVARAQAPVFEITTIDSSTGGQRRYRTWPEERQAQEFKSRDFFDVERNPLITF